MFTVHRHMWMFFTRWHCPKISVPIYKRFLVSYVLMIWLVGVKTQCLNPECLPGMWTKSEPFQYIPWDSGGCQTVGRLLNQEQRNSFTSLVFKAECLHLCWDREPENLEIVWRWLSLCRSWGGGGGEGRGNMTHCISNLTFLQGSSGKCLGLYPAECLGKGAAQFFVIMHTSVFLWRIFAPYGLEISLLSFEETITLVCTLNVSGLQVILLTLILGL